MKKRRDFNWDDLVAFLMEQSEAEAVFNDLEIKEWGTSAHIPMFKKHIGKKVKVIIKKSNKEDVPR